MSDIIWAIVSFPMPILIVYYVNSYLHNENFDSFNIVLITFVTILYVGEMWFILNSEAFGYSVDVVKITLDNAALMY